MSEFKGFNADTEAQFKQIWAYLFTQGSPGLVTDGVLAAEAGGLLVAQTTTASDSVTIALGMAIVQDSLLNGVTPLVNNASKTLDILGADPMGGVPRYDIVVFDAATGTIHNVVGTPNASPSDPTTTATQVRLARLRHSAGNTTVPASHIDDLRPHAYLNLTAPTTEQFARRTTDKSVSSTTTLANDGVLFFQAVAGATYTFECVLFCDSNTASSINDIKLGFGFPTGTLSFFGVGPNNAAFASGSSAEGEFAARNNASSGSTSLPYGISNSDMTLVLVKGNYVCTASGTVHLMWAQNTSGAVVTRVLAGSHLYARKVD